MNTYFKEIKKNFGFGCMRLPMKNDEVDYNEFNKMIDVFLEKGFNYFDTAHGYIEGKSETAIRDCLVSRYPRDSYILTDKLSTTYFETEEEILPVFERQLAACGVDYFDFYLMHAQDTGKFEKYKRCRAYEIVLKLKEEGRIKHFGISFHDKAALLDRILSEYPQIEVVQIQFNYYDYDSENIESRKCYEVCRKHGKPVIVMEPVRGGRLTNLPIAAKSVFDNLNSGTPASYAIRFAASFDGVIMTLSGMSNMEMMLENTGFMKDFVPLSDDEHAVIKKVREILASQDIIPCTGCRYCVEGCPKHIAIPELFECLNAKKQLKSNNEDYYYKNEQIRKGGKASECIKCGKCENICPQQLKIRKLLTDVAAEFELSKV